MFGNVDFSNIEYEDIFIFSLLFTFLLMSLIAIIYYFRSYYLMTAVGITSWSEISDHYKQIKLLKTANWA